MANEVKEKFNLSNFIAVKGTQIFGSMYTTYVFFAYGFLPIILPKIMDKLLYWSNTVQLWSLPLLMVGQNIQGRNTEKLIRETHDTVMLEIKELKEIQINSQEEIKLLREENKCLKAICTKLEIKETGICSCDEA